MAESFLGRWSERKRAVAAGQPVPEPEVKPVAAPPPQALPEPMPPVAVAAPPQPAPVPLTLEDAQALTPQSDFKPFVASHVSPEVRNAAMKKLFTDPHFNVMDRLDIYIDDYSQPDPLPESMLRQMASAQFMGLFDDPPKAQEEEQNMLPGPVEHDQVAPENIATTVHQRPTPDQALPVPSNPPSPDHAHPDLRLQPNHATGPQEPGDGTQ